MLLMNLWALDLRSTISLPLMLIHYVKMESQR
jgi:hypothetical protein